MLLLLGLNVNVVVDLYTKMTQTGVFVVGD